MVRDLARQLGREGPRARVRVQRAELAVGRDERERVPDVRGRHG